MGGQAQADSALQAVIDESASTFEQFTYTDEETGITLEYSLYIPEGYEEGTDTLYPMVMFIPDSTGAGLSSSQIVEEYYGAAVWAGDEDQEKFSHIFLLMIINLIRAWARSSRRPRCTRGCRPL